jgi:uncharacterized protein (TIGR02145 family)
MDGTQMTRIGRMFTDKVSAIILVIRVLLFYNRLYMTILSISPSSLPVWLLLLLPAILLSCAPPEPESRPKYGSVIDHRDGAAYRTLKYKQLIWMADNLRFQPNSLTSLCYKARSECPGYGRLYPWDVAIEACTGLGEGWRLPTDQEWMLLVTDLGGFYNGGERQGEPSQTYLRMIKGGSSGFDILLGGYRREGISYAQDVSGMYWSGTEYDDENAWRYEFFSRAGGNVSRYFQVKTSGYSCRCVKGLVAGQK